MGDRYSSREGVEHAEQAHEAIGDSHHPLLRNVPLIAASLAVLAGLSSLYSSRLGESMLSLKNEAVLAEAQASDGWAEYEADSVKAHLSQTAALGVTNPALHRRMTDDYAEYRDRQQPLRAAALKKERERDADTAAAGKVENRKATFDASVALFEIAIVLASVAAMVRRPWLAVSAGVFGIVAIIAAVRGLLV